MVIVGCCRVFGPGAEGANKVHHMTNLIARACLAGSRRVDLCLGIPSLGERATAVETKQSKSSTGLFKKSNTILRYMMWNQDIPLPEALFYHSRTSPVDSTNLPPYCSFVPLMITSTIPRVDSSGLPGADSIPQLCAAALPISV